MTTFLYSLLGLIAIATMYSAWRLSTQKNENFDEKSASKIDKLEDALREAEMEVATLQERLRSLEAGKSEMSKEFKLMASEALKQQSEDLKNQLKESNSSQLSLVLTPFKEKLEQFGKNVQETHEKGQKERIELKSEVNKLVEQNENLKNEANQLTKALRGDVKMQGNWGEMVLEKLLERTGLTKGREYTVQESVTNEE